MGHLQSIRMLSREVSSRRILLRPPEPPPSYLCPDAGGIYLGRTKMLHVPFFWNPQLLVNPHIAVLGLSGTGKSYLVKTLLSRASFFWGANALILDWAGEYAPWVEKAGGTVIRLGAGGRLNLLELASLAPSIRTKQVMSALSILTDISAHPQQMAITELAMERAYLQKGFGLSKYSARKPPTLKDVEKILLHELARARRSRLASEASIEASLYRIRQLTSPGSDHFAHPSNFQLPHLITSGLVCVDLQPLASEEMRSLAGLTILQFVKERMRSRGWRDEKKVELFVVADEAWKIAKDERSDLVSIVREGRKYSFALIVASQNPTDVNQSIFSNSGTIFLFRTMHAQYKEYLRSSLSYSDYIAGSIERLGLGEPAVHLKFSQNTGFSDTFLLCRIDGEEPMAAYRIGGNMELEFEKGEFRRRLLQSGIPTRAAGEICDGLERAGSAIGASEFVRLLMQSGLQRHEVVSTLRCLGLRESDIVSAISALRERDAHAQGASLTTLVAKKQG